MAQIKTYVHLILNTVNDPSNLVHNQWWVKSFKLENKELTLAGYEACIDIGYIH